MTDNILFYIQEDEIAEVFAREEIGSGSPSFKGLAKPGTRLFVASRDAGELSVAGELTVGEAFENPTYRRGWKYRVRAVEHSVERYRVPVFLKDLKDRLSFLRGVPNIWNVIQYPRRIPDEDAALISSQGRG